MHRRSEASASPTAGRPESVGASWREGPRLGLSQQPDDPGARLRYLDRAARRQGQGIAVALACAGFYLLGVLTLPLVRALFP